MSNEALSATFTGLGGLRAALEVVPAKRRPSYPSCALVAVLLADRMRAGRDWTDETVPQIASTLDLSESVVRSSLAALDQIGWWTPMSKGNHLRGTVRRAAFLDSHRGPGPTQQHRGVSTPASWGSDPASWGTPPQHRGADPATPPTPIVPPTPPPGSEFSTDRVEHVARRVVELRLDRRTPPPTDPDRWSAAVLARLRTDDHGTWWTRLTELVDDHRDDTPIDLLAHAADGDYSRTLGHWRRRDPQTA